MKAKTKIDKMKDFHEWLYSRVKSIYPMDSKTFDNILDKI